jgi:hypothetical protein
VLRQPSVAGLLAFWSLIHVPDHAVPRVFGQFRRVLRPGGPLLLGFHVGDESRLKTQGYGGHPMKVYVHRRPPERMAIWLRNAGLTVEAQMLIDVDESVPGAVLFARQPMHISSRNSSQVPPLRGTTDCEVTASVITDSGSRSTAEAHGGGP